MGFGNGNWNWNEKFLKQELFEKFSRITIHLSLPSLSPPPKSYEQKPYRRAIMETYGAKCYPSPSEHTEVGRKLLEENPDNPGSLGIAISEAVSMAAPVEENKYALGSVLNHVLMHQTVGIFLGRGREVGWE